MRKFAIAVWVLSLFLIIGCAHIPFLGGGSQPADETASAQSPEQPMETGGFVEKGRIVDAALLKQGKNIAVIPFSAGVNVAANDELDRIALNIVKGLADAFAGEAKSPFTVVTAENTDETDFVIQGHVTAVKGPSRLGSWIMIKGHRMISVEGKMVEPQTGETVAVFTDQVTDETENYSDLGYRIGKNIGLFVLSGAD